MKLCPIIIPQLLEGDIIFTYYELMNVQVSLLTRIDQTEVPSLSI